MNLTGMALAQSTRMLETSIPAIPLMFTPPHAASVLTKEADEIERRPEPEEALDKYDPATLACTD